jgi:hypothetical protein
MAGQEAKGDMQSAARAELCGLIDRLDALPRGLPAADLCALGDAARRLARAAGMEPVSRLASALCQAIADGGRAAAIRPYIEGMRAALDCDSQDEETARAFLAAASLRLAG